MSKVFLHCTTENEKGLSRRSQMSQGNRQDLAFNPSPEALSKVLTTQAEPIRPNYTKELKINVSNEEERGFLIGQETKL